MATIKLIYKVVWLLIVLTLLLDCTNDSVSGNTSEVGNAIGILYNPNGSRAANAKVYIVSVDHNPKPIHRIRAIDSITTDDTGAFIVDSVPEGFYNILGSGDSGISYADSIFIDNDTIPTEVTDTLREPGTLRGVISLQGDDDSRTVFILVFGTQTWTTPADSIGNFTLANMAEGTYHVRILTTLDDYSPLDIDLTILSGIDSTLADTIYLPFTGIPIPTGLTLSYDTMKQIVTLTWNACDTNLVKGYNFYRKHSDSDFVKINTALIVDTMFTDNTLSESATYQYKVAAVNYVDEQGVKSGSVSIIFQNRLKLATNNPAFGRRQEHSSVAFNGKMWVIAGAINSSELMNSVWYSSDGITWTEAIDSANFSKRRGHTSVAFDNKMWVIGGFANNGSGGYEKKNDVWYSSDGIIWIQATDSAAFSRRSWHGSTTFSNKMWIAGGNDDVGEKNDVWYSTDGLTWTLSTNSAEFSARAGLIFSAANGKMWIVGGADANGALNDVWYSDIGTTWIQATPSAEFTGRHSFSSAILDSNIWIICGYRAPIGALNDIWYSNDGTHWNKFNIPQNFMPRWNHTSILLDNKIWIIGLESTNHKTEVWYIE